MATERAFVADRVGLGLATRAQHDELRNRRNLRPHGAEAEHGAAADRMPVAGPVTKPVLVVVAIAGQRNVVRMR